MMGIDEVLLSRYFVFVIFQTGIVTSIDNIVPFKFLQLPQMEQDNTMALQLSMQLFEIAR
jgi:hypothetical protein